MSERHHVEVDVDFMDMTDDRRLWVRAIDVRPGMPVAVGRHVIVGDDGADPAVARIAEIDAEGNLLLEVFPGSVQSHRDVLPRA